MSLVRTSVTRESFVVQRPESTASSKAFSALVKPITYQQVLTDQELVRFETYCRNHSHYSILWSCVLPLLLQACCVNPVFLIPLRPTDLGYRIESVSIVFLSSILGNAAIVLFVHHFFPEAKIKNSQYVMLGTLGALCYTCCVSFLSTYICYPFPFVLLVSINACMPIVLGVTYFWLLHPLRKVLPHFKFTLKATGLTLLGFWCLMVIYPGSLQLYHLIQDKQLYKSQYLTLGFTGWLFLLRQWLKKLIIYSCEISKRPAPVIATITVNGFHVMYISIALQSQGEDNWTTVSSVVFLDIVGHVFAYYELYIMRFKQHRGIQLTWPKCASRTVGRCWKRSGVAAMPANSTNDLKEKPLPESFIAREMKKALLPYSADLIMIEYVECLVPILMAKFIWMMEDYSWNKEYFTFYEHMNTNDMQQVQRILWIYSAVEVGVLFLLVVIIHQTLNIPIWHQLGYTLGNNLGIMLSLISTWFLYSIGSGEKHVSSEWKFVCGTPP